MIFDEVARVMEGLSINEVQRKTGLSKGKIYAMRAGCPFVIDYQTIFALQKLGYDITLKEKSRVFGNPTA